MDHSSSVQNGGADFVSGVVASSQPVSCPIEFFSSSIPVVFSTSAFSIHSHFCSTKVSFFCTVSFMRDLLQFSRLLLILLTTSRVLWIILLLFNVLRVIVLILLLAGLAWWPTHNRSVPIVFFSSIPVVLSLISAFFILSLVQPKFSFHCVSPL